MSKILAKKIKKLQKELDYWESELEYVQEILGEWHLNFEEYYQEYCKTNNIDIARLNEENKKKVDQLIPKPVKKQDRIEDGTDEKHFKKIYKQIAKKLHPDIGGDEEQFKEATAAVQEKDLKKLLDICEKNDIIITLNEEMINILQKQILVTKQKIDKEKSTYSWNLYSCGNDKNCKDNIIRNFLKHLFNYQKVIKI